MSSINIAVAAASKINSALSTILCMYVFQVHHKWFITICCLRSWFHVVDHEAGNPTLGSGSNERAWTILGSF
jgi:hypothetical protein